jgi:uncharacterized membrane protein HdeD (DUF308 family)
MDRKRNMWLLALRGVIAIVFGVLAILWPGVTLLALAILFGAYALVGGVATMVAAFRRDQDAARRTAQVIAGLLGVAAGVIAFVWPGITALILVILVGAWALVTGAMEIWAATRVPGQWLALVVGALTMIIGVIVLLRPAIGAVALGFTIGVYAIVAGVLMLAAAWHLHHTLAGPRRTDRIAPAGA